MSKMRAIDAAVRVLEKEGVVCAFAVPGAAINPLYSALKKRGSINHTEIDNITEFEQTLDLPLDEPPVLPQGKLLPA